ncbi:MAG: GTPase HflX, partial [Candidatus Omnitrophica bacterium]|nr:GTPase HflX [Candidatus Omnitrophota bacterium]
MFETAKKELALLVVVKEKTEPLSHDELGVEFKNLALSTGISVAEVVYVKLNKPNPSIYIGKGKAEELAAACLDCGADTVIFNTNLNFTQQRNLESLFKVKTIDRTQLILDIFARHAQSQEGILQVELAQLEYLLPRLRGKGIMLSRLGGGIGTRGPGETKLEADRRKISVKILKLKKELMTIKEHHDVVRKKRDKAGVEMCSLVGYTNAGKTTIFNVLTEDSQATSDALFTTLDTVTRMCPLDASSKVVLSDTVGFIYKLPPQLIEAFKTTLDELQFADVLIHVIDASSKNIIQYKKAVDGILEELKLTQKPIITVFNKIDRIENNLFKILKEEYPDSIFISAKNRINIKELKDEIYKNIYKDIIEVIAKVPFERMDAANFFHQNYEVL